MSEKQATDRKEMTMINDGKAYAATPHEELIAQILDPALPKNEREHAACREIERLREELQAARVQIDLLRMRGPAAPAPWTTPAPIWERPYYVTTEPYIIPTKITCGGLAT